MCRQDTILADQLATMSAPLEPRSRQHTMRNELGVAHQGRIGALFNSCGFCTVGCDTKALGQPGSPSFFGKHVKMVKYAREPDNATKACKVWRRPCFAEGVISSLECLLILPCTSRSYMSFRLGHWRYSSRSPSSPAADWANQQSHSSTPAAVACSVAQVPKVIS